MPARTGLWRAQLADLSIVDRNSRPGHYGVTRILNAIVPPALVATAHSLMVTFPAEETNADHTAPTPGVLTGEIETAILVAAISGHRTESTYRRYDIVSPGDMETAKQKLTDYARTSTKLSTMPERKKRGRL